MADLSNKTNRKKLKPRAAIYTQKLAEGRALGYRKRRSNTPGRWVLRTARFPSGYNFEVLGVADDYVDADGREVLTYSQALAASLGRKAADPNKMSVGEALDIWTKMKCREASSEKQRLDIESSAKRIAVELGRKTLKGLSGKDVAQWMECIVSEGDDPQRRRSTANRRLAILKAACTLAADQNDYSGPRGWETAKKFPKAESFGARQVILTPEQEADLISVARPDVQDLLTALQMTGARYGEIRSATVSDLHGNRLRLVGKTGARTIALSPEKAEWFSQRAADRPSDAPLLTRRDGSGWPDGGQLKPVRTAVKAAGLTPDVTTYALRHGFISRALGSGVPVAAVAQHCGTSVEMIMRSYAKFAPAQMQEWFA